MAAGRQSAERSYEDEVIVVIHQDCPLHKIVRKPMDDVLGDHKAKPISESLGSPRLTSTPSISAQPDFLTQSLSAPSRPVRPGRLGASG